MGHGLFKSYSFTMGAAIGSATVNLGRGYPKVYLQVPTFASTTGIDIYASPDGTQTYYQIRKEVPVTTTVQSWSFSVAASAMANGGLSPIPPGFQYYKIVATDSAPSGALSFQVYCGDT